MVGERGRDEFEDEKERGADKRLDDLLSLYTNRLSVGKRKDTEKGAPCGYVPTI